MAILTAIQGVPHTGALRTLSLLLIITQLIWIWSASHKSWPGLHGGIEVTLFWLLTLWLVVHSTLIAQTPLIALQTVADNWGKLLLLTVVGITLAWLVDNRRRIVMALFVGAYFHTGVALWVLGLGFADTGRIVYVESMFGNGNLISSFVAISFAFLLADGISRVWHHRSLFPWPTIVTILSGLAALFVQIMLKAKAGQVMTIVLIAVAVLAMLSRSKVGRRWSVALAVLGVLAGWQTVREENSRWSGFMDSMQTAWRNPIPIPALLSDRVAVPSGLNHSPYVRSIRYRAGLEGVVLFPLGFGYTTDVYRHYLATRYGISEGIESSNSGLLDFGLATGIPGIVLLLSLSVALIWRGWSAFIVGRPEGAVLAFVVLQHIGRYALDGTLAGSRFSGMAIIIGALWGLLALHPQQEKTGTYGG
ncbi:MAG: hypothetical protein AB1642_01705 [Pseudomonadota bacterium]